MYDNYNETKKDLKANMKSTPFKLLGCIYSNLLNIVKFVGLKVSINLFIVEKCFSEMNEKARHKCTIKGAKKIL